MDQDLVRYEMAAAYLPTRLRRAALSIPRQEQRIAEEFRLRAGRPMTILLPGGELSTGGLVESNDLETLCDLSTEFSRYAALETIREGFIPVKGGFRVGLCGTAVMKDGCSTNIKCLSSACIRISREHIGVGESVVSELFRKGEFCSTLILSPPGGGKTTLLRDLIRCISDGISDHHPRRVSLVDERGEVAVSYQGFPQLEVGAHTDVLDACPKSIGIPMLVRSMNPEIIAVDEITTEGDVRAMVMASGCGVGLLATIHAENTEELLSRPLYRSLLEAGVFRLAVLIQNQNGARTYTVEDLPK